MIDRDAARAAAADLHAKMTLAGDSLFLPTGGAFLSMSPSRTEAIISQSRSLTNEDVFDTYATWHEGVHMAQLVTSPFLFPIAFDMAGLAQRAHRVKTGLDDNATDVSDLALRYRRLCAVLEEPVGGFSPIDVIETHAVTQGFRWTMAHNNGSDLRFIANYFYEDQSPKYVRLLNDVCTAFDDDVGTILLPRFCFLSLQAELPVQRLFDLLNKLGGAASFSEIVAYSPAQLCEWAGAPIQLVTRSLRERAASFMRDPQGNPVRLTDHPWVGIFRHHFDQFEDVMDAERRLDLLMGWQGGYAYPQFSPLFRIY